MAVSCAPASHSLVRVARRCMAGKTGDWGPKRNSSPTPFAGQNKRTQGEKTEPAVKDTDASQGRADKPLWRKWIEDKLANQSVEKGTLGRDTANGPERASFTEDIFSESTEKRSPVRDADKRPGRPSFSKDIFSKSDFVPESTEQRTPVQDADKRPGRASFSENIFSKPGFFSESTEQRTPARDADKRPGRSSVSEDFFSKPGFFSESTEQRTHVRDADKRPGRASVSEDFFSKPGFFSESTEQRAPVRDADKRTGRASLSEDIFSKPEFFSDRGTSRPSSFSSNKNSKENFRRPSINVKTEPVNKSQGLPRSTELSDFEHRVLGAAFDNNSSDALDDDFLRDLDEIGRSARGIRGSDDEDDEEQDWGDEKAQVLTDLALSNVVEYDLEDEERPYQFRPDRLFFPGQTYDPEDLDISKSVEEMEKPTVRIKKRLFPKEVLKCADFRNPRFLSNFIRETSRILPRRSVGISAKAQRKVAREIKTARILGLMPFTSMGDPPFRFMRSRADDEPSFVSYDSNR